MDGKLVISELRKVIDDLMMKDASLFLAGEIVALVEAKLILNRCLEITAGDTFLSNWLTTCQHHIDWIKGNIIPSIEMRESKITELYSKIESGKENA